MENLVTVTSSTFLETYVEHIIQYYIALDCDYSSTLSRLMILYGSCYHGENFGFLNICADADIHQVLSFRIPKVHRF